MSKFVLGTILNGALGAKIWCVKVRMEKLLHILVSRTDVGFREWCCNSATARPIAKVKVRSRRPQ